MTLALVLDSAVRRLCPEVASRAEAKQPKRLSEAGLWRELACCVLSSQVKYETALAAAEALVAANVFADFLSARSDSYVKHRALKVLSSPLKVQNRCMFFRFPFSKAHQLIQTRRMLLRAGVSLRDLVYQDSGERTKRRHLIALVSGFGPKQASMFLRAAGVSFDLAILDTHVLKFMALLGLAQHSELKPYLSLHRYEALEQQFERYANEVGYHLGYVDWAVWIVMRALKQLGR